MASKQLVIDTLSRSSARLIEYGRFSSLTPAMSNMIVIDQQLSQPESLRLYIYKQRHYFRDELLALRPDLRWSLALGDQVENFRAETEERARIFERDLYQCVDCFSPYDLTIDHVIPRSKGGSDDDDNKETRCRRCNSRKGAKLL